MANPRQKRKQRSGNAKVKHSKQSLKNKHKVIVKGPEILVKSWDRKKTVRQNYAKLGLMPNLNPRQAGGIEAVEVVPFAVASATSANISDAEFDSESAESSEDEEPGKEILSEVEARKDMPGPTKLAKGLGRIERDEHGKVVRIVLVGDDGLEIEEEVKAVVRSGGDNSDHSGEDSSDDDHDSHQGENLKTPWGNPMEQWIGEDGDEVIEHEVILENTETRTTGQGIPHRVKREKIVAKTDVVKELEDLSSRHTKTKRHTSSLESDWLFALVQRYGNDVDQMARDRKLNVWQKTSGEIRRALVKAGASLN